MPRKKTIQHPPLETRTIVSGLGIAQEIITVEIRDETCPETGKGIYQTHKHDARRDNICSELVELGLDEQKAILESPKAFLEWFLDKTTPEEVRGDFGLNYSDTKAIKGLLYQKVKRNMQALWNAQEKYLP